MSLINLSADHVADQLYKQLGELVKAGVLFHFADSWNSIKGTTGAPKLMQDLAASVVDYPETKVQLLYREVLTGGRMALFESLFEILALKEQRGLATFLGIRVDNSSVFFVPEPLRYFHEILLSVARHLHANPFIFANSNSDIPLAIDIIVRYIPHAVKVAMMSTVKLQQLCDRRQLNLGDTPATDGAAPALVVPFSQETGAVEEAVPETAPATDVPVPEPEEDQRIVALMDDGVEQPAEPLPVPFVSNVVPEPASASKFQEDAASEAGSREEKEESEEEEVSESEPEDSEEEAAESEPEEKKQAPARAPAKKAARSAPARGRAAPKKTPRKRRSSSASSKGSIAFPSSDQISGMVSKMLSDGTAQNILGKITGGAGIDGLLSGLSGPAKQAPASAPAAAVAPPKPAATPPTAAPVAKSAWS